MDTLRSVKTMYHSSSEMKCQWKCLIIWLFILTVVMFVMQGMLSLALFQLYSKTFSCENCTHQSGSFSSQTLTQNYNMCTNISFIIEQIKSEIIKNSSSVWTPIDTAFTYITLNPNVSSSKIYLSSIGVPLTADKALVYVEVGTGTTNKNDITGRIEVYSMNSFKQFLLVHGYMADDWSYNSDNMWVPIGTERIVYAKFNGSEAITINYYAKMKIIGYQ